MLLPVTNERLLSLSYCSLERNLSNASPISKTLIESVWFFFWNRLNRNVTSNINTSSADNRNPAVFQKALFISWDSVLFWNKSSMHTPIGNAVLQMLSCIQGPPYVIKAWQSHDMQFIFLSHLLSILYHVGGQTKRKLVRWRSEPLVHSLSLTPKQDWNYERHTTIWEVEDHYHCPYSSLRLTLPTNHFYTSVLVFFIIGKRWCFSKTLVIFNK